MNETKDKILDTAERLFAEQGCAAVSLRHIIAEAGVNLAAIHYHFGSKEELLEAVVMRKIGPVNEQRLAMLNQLEAEYGDAPLPLEKVVEALFTPGFLKGLKSPQFVRLMGRLHAEGGISALFERHFKTVVDRFGKALMRALPELSRTDLTWRVHFMMGAMAHALSGPPHMRPDLKAPPREIAARLVEFVCAGLRAPVGKFTDTEVES